MKPLNKEIKKPKAKVKISTLRNKADKELQELGRSLNQFCEICGKAMSCMHHFWPKSTASSLRYSLKNLVAVCQGCHMQHHNGNPSIHATIIEQRGQDWYNELLKDKGNFVKTNAEYYKGVIKTLETLIN